VPQKSRKRAGAPSDWRPDQPFNGLLPLPPRPDTETKPVLKRCISARAALAELKQAAELIPNQAVLINTLPLLEAQASSEIENIVTTTDRLFQFRELEEEADPATKEALRYSHATLRAFASLKKRPLCTRTAEEICTWIKGQEMRPDHSRNSARARQWRDRLHPARRRRSAPVTPGELGTLPSREQRGRSPHPHGGGPLPV
jgi:hypothetical protein